MVKNVIFHQQSQVKKYHPSLFQYICVNHIVKFLNNSPFKFKCNPTDSSQTYCAGIVFKKMYLYVFISENAECFT